jgi:hypothetical protein
MTDSKNKTCGDEQPCGIVSDVPIGDPEHDRLIHELAQRINKHVDDEPDEPKIKNRCGTCLVFHTPFCIWESKDYDKETMKALHVDANAYACSSHYPFKLRAMHNSERSFERKVANLE